MATAKVFGTNELLELVLAHLPSRELLLSQRVCRTWRKIIKTTERLQRALFLKPFGPLLTTFIDAESQALLDAGPQDIPAIERLSGRRSTFIRWSDSEDNTLAFVPLLNPMLHRLCLAAEHTRFVLEPSTLAATNSHTSKGLRQTSTKESWRDMYLTQPPVRRITLVKMYWKHDSNEVEVSAPFNFENKHPHHYDIDNPLGLTINNLIQALQYHCFPDGGLVTMHFGTLTPLLGSYWRQVSNISAATMSSQIREFEWASTDKGSPIGWEPFEDDVDMFGRPLKFPLPEDETRGNECDRTWTERIRAKRDHVGGIGVLGGKLVFGPRRPPHEHR